MTEWNSEQYLKFKKQRTQPSIDLVRRINTLNPKNILDIGCGPGNSTHVLKESFPNAQIVGIDNSENMIERAKAIHPNLEFKRMSVEEICSDPTKYDILFSNACLQWVPDHREILPLLFNKLNENGVLAVQMPINAQEPLFTIIEKIVNDKKWGFLPSLYEKNTPLKADEYFDLLSTLTDHFEIWETVYYHKMPSINAMIDWVKGTRLLPYIQALNETEAQSLIHEITINAAKAYKKQENGEIIFRFRRLFFIAFCETK